MNIYVRKCGSKNDFRYFLFNNNVLQGIFDDGSQIIISLSNNLYINKYGEHRVFFEGSELPSEASKKYQYLANLLKNYKPSVKLTTKGKQNSNSCGVSRSQSLLKKQTSTSTANDSKQNSMGNKKIPVATTERTRR